MFKTIAKIVNHISCVQRALLSVADELRERAIVHDQSKFREDELRGYLRFEDMPEGLVYGSDEYKAAMARVMKDNDCFELHSKRNDHHPEFYEDVRSMRLMALIEMVCDWAGAHLAYGNKSNWKDSVRHNIDRYGFDHTRQWIILEMADLLEQKIPELGLQE